MLRSDFARFGLGLETLLKTHIYHKAVKGPVGNLALDLRGKYRVIEAIMKNAGD